MWKWWLIAIAAAVGLMNAARVDRTNTPVNPSESIEAHTQMPPNVAAVFHRACHNCHRSRRIGHDIAPSRQFIGC
jgi:mono/diheme cytochrome c family protein